MQSTTFQDLPVGTEFLWGGYKPETMNWGRKRSSRTADYRPRISGELSEYKTWGYFGQTETVYL